VTRARLKGRLMGTASSIIAQTPLLRRRLLQAAAARGRSLVLCYHTIGPHRHGEQIIEPIAPELFAAQMRALKEIGDIVPLADVLRRRSGTRPAFAVTFDDDDPSHARYALPVLRELGIRATFFLSGRSLHGLGAYWWTRLQQSAEELGLDEASRRIGHTGRTLEEVARACRADAFVRELETTAALPTMTVDDMRTLADAGMTFGFHTIQHPLLTKLSRTELATALIDGRETLADAVGQDIEYLAYPYGRVDARVASMARRLGYSAAFIVGDRPTHASGDPMLVMRWQPGSATPDRLIAQAALRLMLSPRFELEPAHELLATVDHPAEIGANQPRIRVPDGMPRGEIGHRRDPAAHECAG
jgi:peptidoglycan/xylan/chitin deacetylase (PgdA/CDA1 family)